MNKQKLAALFLSSMLLLTVTGCSTDGAGSSQQEQSSQQNVQESSETSQANTIEINFVNWGSGEDSTKAAFEAMIKNYEETNPNIKIKNTTIPYNQFLEQVLIMTSGGSAPDAAQIHGSMVSALVSSGALAPLDDLISKEAMEDFLPNALEPLIYDGKTMATPWSPSPDVLYYNKTLLNQAGYENPPKTWDEMKEMSEKIAALGNDENGNKIYGLGIATKKLAGTGYSLLPYLWANGGDISDESGNVTLNTPEVVETFTDIKTLIDNGVTPNGLEANDIRNLFAQGQIGFVFDGDYGYTTFSMSSPKGEEFLKEIDTAVPPENMSVFYEHDLGVFADSKVQQEAANFIEYLSAPEAMHIYNESGVCKTPGRKSVRELEDYNPEKNPTIQVFLDTLDVSRGFPQKNSGFIKSMEVLADALQRVTLNQEDPQSVAEDLDQQVKELYAKG